MLYDNSSTLSDQRKCSSILLNLVCGLGITTRQMVHNLYLHKPSLKLFSVQVQWSLHFQTTFRQKKYLHCLKWKVVIKCRDNHKIRVVSLMVGFRMEGILKSSLLIKVH